MAFACRPRVIVCDEPTTGLDVTTQARVLETVRELCRSHRRRGALRQPRPGRRRRAGRPRRGDVRRPDRRGRHARPAVQRAAPPVHAAAAARRPRPRGQARRRRHPRPRAAAGQPAGGLLLPSALHRWRRDAAGASSRRRSDVGGGHIVRCHHAAEARARDRGRGRPRPRRRRAAPELVLAIRGLDAHHGTRAHAVRDRPRGAPQRVPGARRRVRVGQDDARALRRRAAQGLHGRRRAWAATVLPPAARRRRTPRARRSSTSSRTRTPR